MKPLSNEAKRNIAIRYKQFHGCSSCGFKGHYSQLQFDHIDPSDKHWRLKQKHKSSIYQLSTEDFRAEIRKCRVLCANCHLKHSREQVLDGTIKKGGRKAVQKPIETGFMMPCSKCHEFKQEHFFSIVKNMNRGRNSWCQSCLNKKAKEDMDRKQALISRYKTMKGCSSCGIKEQSSALQLDHIDPATKDDKLKNRTTSGLKSMSWVRLRAEIRKCRVLCGNCHSLHTFEQNI